MTGPRNLPNNLTPDVAGPAGPAGSAGNPAGADIQAPPPPPTPNSAQQTEEKNKRKAEEDRQKELTEAAQAYWVARYGYLQWTRFSEIDPNSSNQLSPPNPAKGESEFGGISQGSASKKNPLQEGLYKHPKHDFHMEIKKEDNGRLTVKSVPFPPKNFEAATNESMNILAAMGSTTVHLDWADQKYVHKGNLLTMIGAAAARGLKIQYEGNVKAWLHSDKCSNEDREAFYRIKNALEVAHESDLSRLGMKSEYARLTKELQDAPPVVPIRMNPKIDDELAKLESYLNSAPLKNLTDRCDRDADIAQAWVQRKMQPDAGPPATPEAIALIAALNAAGQGKDKAVGKALWEAAKKQPQESLFIQVLVAIKDQIFGKKDQPFKHEAAKYEQVVEDVRKLTSSERNAAYEALQEKHTALNKLKVAVGEEIKKNTDPASQQAQQKRLDDIDKTIKGLEKIIQPLVDKQKPQPQADQTQSVRP